MLAILATTPPVVLSWKQSSSRSLQDYEKTHKTSCADLDGGSILARGAVGG